jgi:hypothetical protein
MTNQPFAQRVARAVGEGGSCFFCWDAFGIEKMVGDKMINSSFSRAAGSGMRAPSAGAGAGAEADLPWA